MAPSAGLCSMSSSNAAATSTAFQAGQFLRALTVPCVTTDRACCSRRNARWASCPVTSTKRARSESCRALAPSHMRPCTRRPWYICVCKHAITHAHTNTKTPVNQRTHARTRIQTRMHAQQHTHTHEAASQGLPRTASRSPARQDAQKMCILLGAQRQTGSQPATQTDRQTRHHTRSMG